MSENNEQKSSVGAVIATVIVALVCAAGTDGSIVGL